MARVGRNTVLSIVVALASGWSNESFALPIAEIQATGLAPNDQPDASPEIASFGDIPVSGFGFRLISVTNAGDEELEIGTPTTSGGFELVPLKGDDSGLETGESAYYFVQYTPAEAGAVVGSIFFPHNGGPGSDVSITLLATGVAKDVPAIRVLSEDSDVFNGTTVSLGSEDVGDPEDYTFTIYNNGTEPLEIGEVSSSDASLIVDEQPTSPIAPGDTDTFKLINLAEAPGERTSNISFTTNVPGLKTFSFTASFAVNPQEPVLRVSTEDGIVTSGSTFVASTTNEDDDGEIEVELENIGSATLTIDSVELTPGFTTDFATASLDADESDTIDITFDASTPGIKTGTLTITTDSVVSPVFTLNLEANVIPENTAFLLATVDGDDDELESGDDIEFPKRPVGVNPQRVLTLTNLGSVDLVFSSITTSSGFTASLPNATIEPATSVDVTLTSVPTRPGKLRGQLVLEGPGSRVVFKLESEATPAGSGLQVFQGSEQLSLREEGKFPPIFAGSTATAQLVLTNVGTTDLQLGGVSSPTPGVTGINFDASILAGQSTSATLEFAPETDRVPKYIVINIATDSELVPTVSFKMETEIRDTPCEFSLFDDDDLDVPDDSDVDFGSTDVGNPVQRTFDIVNSGIGDLTIRKLKAPKGFRVVTPPASLLEPGDSTSFTVELTAARPGSPRGKVTCSTNDPDEKKFAFNVQGAVNLPLAGPAPTWEDSVDSTMVARVLARFGATGIELDEDLNDDGVVNVTDLLETLMID